MDILSLLCVIGVGGITVVSFFLWMLPRTPSLSKMASNRGILVEPNVFASSLCNGGKPLKHFYKGVKTIPDCFQHGIQLSKNGPCLGRRNPVDGPYEWMSYKEVEANAHCIGSGFLQNKIDIGDYVGIWASNSVEWIMTELALEMYSMVCIALYNTFGIDGCIFIITQTSMRVIVVDKTEKVTTLLDHAQEIPSIKKIIIIEDEPSEDLNAKAKTHGIELKTLNELMEVGNNNLKNPVPPHPLDVATICYTSGTTGNPKGAILTHENLVANSVSVLMVADSYSGINITDNDIHISYLPLAHMFERVAQLICFTRGARIGVNSGDVRNLTSDLMALKPTIFVTVPRVLNRIHSKIEETRLKSGLIKKFIFSYALKKKTQMLNKGIMRNDTIWDKFVFRKIRENLGGRVKIIISGAASLSPRIQSDIICYTGAIVVQAYGQTEGTCGITFQNENDWNSGTLGPPLPCNYVKLVDIPDMDYFVKDNVGEVYVKGSNIMQGYFKDVEKTSEVKTADGWLATGDVGMWHNGSLKLIDRKKCMFKLAQGEYISPDKVESVYQENPLILHAFVDGDPFQQFPVGIIVPNEDVLMPWATENGFTGTFEELCRNPELNKSILEIITKLGQEASLNKFEQVKCIYLHETPFTIENGFLTPTLKAKRKVLRNHFKTQFTAMYIKLAKL